jgi:hypothetical protein
MERIADQSPEQLQVLLEDEVGLEAGNTFVPSVGAHPDQHDGTLLAH